MCVNESIAWLLRTKVVLVHQGIWMFQGFVNLDLSFVKNVMV